MGGGYVYMMFLTARGQKADVVTALESGADDYLTKPFDTRELQARVDNLIASRRRLREHFAATSAPPAAKPQPPSGPGATHEAALSPNPVSAESKEALFLSQVRDSLETGYTDEAFGVEHLAEAVGMSRAHLYRQLKALRGQTPSEALWTFRVERGAQLLAAGAGNVSEVAYAVGFRSVSHFSKRFKQHLDCCPSVYAPDS